MAASRVTYRRDDLLKPAATCRGGFGECSFMYDVGSYICTVRLNDCPNLRVNRHLGKERDIP